MTNVDIMPEDGENYGTVEAPLAAKYATDARPTLPLSSGNAVNHSRSSVRRAAATASETQRLHPAHGTIFMRKDDQGEESDALNSGGSWGRTAVRMLSSAKMKAFCAVFVAALLAVVGAALLQTAATQNSNLTSTPSAVAAEYDFIIVGGGPAGSVLAKRLSDDLSNQVLLLEAGMPSQYELGGQDFLSNPLTPFDIPLMWPSVSHMSDFHWEVRDYTKRGNPNALVAKALGGCGIHNAMLYVRGLETDFKKWDVEGFDYESAMATWKGLENYTGPGALPDWHGRGGPISTTPPTFIDEVAPYFVESCVAAGVNKTEDFNKPGGRAGVGYYQFTVRDGVRDAASRAMLGDIIMGKDLRTNLHIRTTAHVNRVLIEEATGEQPGEHVAVGVEFMLDGRLQTARIAADAARHGHAGRAVIVTAGALNTPKVLMKSGVGDKAELEASNLRTIMDLPALGKNLQDHTSVGVMYVLGPDILMQSPSAYTVAQELERYKMRVLKAYDLGFPPGVTMDGIDSDDVANGTEDAPSIFSSAGLSAGAFLRSPFTSHPEWANSSAPDIQLTVFPRVTEPHVLALADILPSLQASPMMLVTVSILDPEGRAVVRLDPDNPVTGNPLITADTRDGAPPPLTDLDAEKLAWGVVQVRRIMDTSPLRELLLGEVYPGPGFGTDAEEGKSAAEMIDWVRMHVYSNSHWCGTARMGRASDPDTVVDETMQVKGVQGLYVGDASVIPFIPNGNVHSTVLLVASKLADMLIVHLARARAQHEQSGAASDDTTSVKMKENGAC